MRHCLKDKQTNQWKNESLEGVKEQCARPAGQAFALNHEGLYFSERGLRQGVVLFPEKGYKLKYV